jgi:hypothetical protein
MSSQAPTPVSEPLPARKRRINPIWIFLGALLLIVAAGGSAGYFSGQQLHADRQQADLLTFDLEQFQLAKTDFNDGNYRRAVDPLE